jgi:hypothetical protein
LSFTEKALKQKGSIGSRQTQSLNSTKTSMTSKCSMTTGQGMRGRHHRITSLNSWVWIGDEYSAAFFASKINARESELQVRVFACIFGDEIWDKSLLFTVPEVRE